MSHGSSGDLESQLDEQAPLLCDGARPAEGGTFQEPEVESAGPAEEPRPSLRDRFKKAFSEEQRKALQAWLSANSLQANAAQKTELDRMVNEALASHAKTDEDASRAKGVVDQLFAAFNGVTATLLPLVLGGLAGLAPSRLTSPLAFLVFGLAETAKALAQSGMAVAELRDAKGKGTAAAKDCLGAVASCSAAVGAFMMWYAKTFGVEGIDLLGVTVPEFFEVAFGAGATISGATGIGASLTPGGKTPATLAFMSTVVNLAGLGVVDRTLGTGWTSGKSAYPSLELAFCAILFGTAATPLALADAVAALGELVPKSASALIACARHCTLLGNRNGEGQLLLPRTSRGDVAQMKEHDTDLNHASGFGKV